MPEHCLSLYIPCVYCNISKQFLLETFRNMGLGEVSRIDFVQRQINNIDNSVSHPFNQAFVYFAYWNRNPIVDKLHREILNPNLDAKLVYDEPYFWRLLPNCNPRYKENNDLRTVIMELQDRAEHQSNLLTIMSQRIFDLSYIINNISKQQEEQNFSNNKLPDLGVPPTVYDDNLPDLGVQPTVYDDNLPELSVQPTVCADMYEEELHEDSISESSYDILGEEN